MSSSPELLEGVEMDREDSFSTFHRTYYQAVYSAALRHVRDPELAADVTQVVFHRAAQKFGELPDPRWALAWLFRTAHYVALELLRKESVQKKIQEKYKRTLGFENSEAPRASGCEMYPSIKKLRSHEQEAIRLRYYEEKSFQQIARELGISEHAAKKRVTRATERLGVILRKNKTDGNWKFIASSWIKLIQSFKSSPPILSNKPLLLFMAKIKAGLTVVALVAACVTGIHFYSQYLDLKKSNESLASRLEEMKAIPPLTDTHQSNSGDKKQQEELNQLRNEVGVLRKQKTAMATLAAENESLKRKYLTSTERKGPENAELEATKDERIALMTEAKKGALGAIMFAEANNGFLPADLQSMAQATVTNDPVNLDPFELLPNYKPFKISDLKTSPAMTILFRGKDVTRMPNGKFARAYAFVDGHSEIHSSDTPDFSAWENERSQY